MSGFKQNSSDHMFEDGLGEVLFEFVTIGNAVKVSAVHAQTNIEVSVLGSPNMSAFTLKANALRKLKSVLARRSQ